MLSFQTVLPDTLELLKKLMQQPLLKDMRLVGGTYFADADPQPMPYMFQKVDWETIKMEIKRQVEEYNRQKI